MNKRTLRGKILANTLVAGISVLIAALALSLGLLYSYFSEQYRQGIENDAQYLAQAVNIGKEEYLSTLDTKRRITVVAPDGSVLWDSVSDAATLENHAEREEIRQAIDTGKGFSQRYSSTLSKKTVYAAVRLSDGDILRVSDTQYTLFSLIASIWWQLLLICALALLLCFLLSRRIARAITEPINGLNPANPDGEKIYEELQPLVGKITEQNRQIDKQLADLREEHRKQDDMRRDFTANVSHELKTPLTSISGYAELINTGIAKPEDIRRFSGKIFDESKRLIILVGDIIKLSQLDAKEIAVKTAEIDLYEMCESVAEQLSLPAKKKNVTVTVSGTHEKITGAEQIIEEMIFNICDNAVKYNRDGGTVEISVTRFVDGVEFSCRDTGIGIPREDIPHIFERFYRVDKSHSKEIGGTGLGLSIVKHGALYTGATVTVDSEVGKGTVIRLLF